MMGALRAESLGLARCIIIVGKRTAHRGWWVVTGHLAIRRRTQDEAARFARVLATEHELGGGCAQVVIRGKDGQIKREWTYPRSSDPRRSKG